MTHNFGVTDTDIQNTFRRYLENQDFANAYSYVKSQPQSFSGNILDALKILKKASLGEDIGAGVGLPTKKREVEAIKIVNKALRAQEYFLKYNKQMAEPNNFPTLNTNPLTNVLAGNIPGNRGNVHPVMLQKPASDPTAGLRQQKIRESYLIRQVRAHPKSTFTAGIAGGVALATYFPGVVGALKSFVSHGTKIGSEIYNYGEHISKGIGMYETLSKAYKLIYPNESAENIVNPPPTDAEERIAKGLELASVLTKNFFEDSKAPDLLKKLAQIIQTKGLRAVPGSLFNILEPMIERGGDINFNSQDLRKEAINNFSDSFTRENFKRKTQENFPYYRPGRDELNDEKASQILKEDLKVHNTQNERGSRVQRKAIPKEPKVPKKVYIIRNK